MSALRISALRLGRRGIRHVMAVGFVAVCFAVLILNCGGDHKTQPPPTVRFRFLSWADSKDHPEILQGIAGHASATQPAFSVFPGDLALDAAPNDTWKNAINGGSSPGNGLFDKTFAMRGNHDIDAAGWVSFFEFAAVANRVGANNFSALSTDETYSFDYGNAHVVAIEMPSGDISTMTQSQWEWLDRDLTTAEQRSGIEHAFLVWHGPLWPVDSHLSIPPAALIDVLNRHPIVAASFHGHEHLQAHVRFDQSHIAGVTHAFEQFITGTTGASTYSCVTSRLNSADWCESFQGFTSVDVDGGTIAATFYDSSGAARKVVTFTHNR